MPSTRLCKNWSMHRVHLIQALFCFFCVSWFGPLERCRTSTVPSCIGGFTDCMHLSSAGKTSISHGPDAGVLHRRQRDYWWLQQPLKSKGPGTGPAQKSWHVSGYMSTPGLLSRLGPERFANAPHWLIDSFLLKTFWVRIFVFISCMCMCWD